MFEWFSQHIGGPTVMIFIGAIISAAGVLWASIEKTKLEMDSKEKSLEISELNKQIAMSITGGDSFCYIGHPLDGSQGNKLHAAIVHKGKYPLYDVNLRIVDLEKTDSFQKQGLSFPEAVNKSQTIVNVGNISPNFAMILDTIDLTGLTRVRYNVFIVARNDLVTQNIRLQNINGTWKGAMKVRRDGKTILENIDPNYPRNSQGEIDWE